MTCAHCGGSDAIYKWTLTACADECEPRERMLCFTCDVELNRITLAFFRDPEVDEKLARYVAPEVDHAPVPPALP